MSSHGISPTRKSSIDPVPDAKITSDRILFEDNHLIAINKRASELVQGDKSGDLPLSEALKLFIKERDAKPGNVYLGVAHRLDRPVSGVVVFAKTSKALSRLNRMFQEKTVQKTYWAVVKSKPKNPQGQLRDKLWKNEARNKSFVARPGQNGKEATLDYQLLDSSDNYSLLEVLPRTGRHHQIRVQLSAMGCPIKGDVKYGATRTNPDASIHLHARKISFTHPVKQEPLEIVAPPPKESLWEYFDRSVRS